MSELICSYSFRVSSCYIHDSINESVTRNLMRESSKFRLLTSVGHGESYVNASRKLKVKEDRRGRCKMIDFNSRKP